MGSEETLIATEEEEEELERAPLHGQSILLQFQRGRLEIRCSDVVSTLSRSEVVA